MADYTVKNPQLEESIITHQRRTATAAKVTGVKTVVDANAVKLTAIQVETDKVPATVTKIDGIKTETDKVPATITKIDGIKTETDKVPAIQVQLDRMVGQLKKKAISIAGTGATVIDCFDIVGAIAIKEIYLELKTAADTTTLSNVRFSVNDATATVHLTAVVDASGYVAGALIGKLGNLAAGAVGANADQIRAIQHATEPQAFYEVIVNCKPEVDNKIQLLFTGDAATEAEATVHVRYAVLSEIGSVTPTA